MLDEYYDLHGWDKKTSWPFKETLEGLKLEEVARELESLGKIQSVEKTNYGYQIKD